MVNGEHGRVRRGLETWLMGRGDGLSEALVESARLLADAVDRAPSASPLWGRYQFALDQLADAAVDLDSAVPAVVESLREEFASRAAVETFRAARHAAAIADGDEAEAARWQRLVPIGCVQGVHRWHQWRAAPTPTCLDCGTEVAR